MQLTAAVVSPTGQKKFNPIQLKHIDGFPQLQVTLDATRLEGDRDYHGTVTIHTDAGDIELPLRALAPRCILSLDGDLSFGAVAQGTTWMRTLTLQNRGAQPADFTLDWDK